jgi:hypothetical protein
LQQQTSASVKAQSLGADAPPASSHQSSTQAEGSDKHQDSTKTEESDTILSTSIGASQSI